MKIVKPLLIAAAVAAHCPPHLPRSPPAPKPSVPMRRRAHSSPR